MPVNDLKLEVRLNVPSNSNYDLRVYRGCTLVGSSTNGTGTNEIVTVTQTDVPLHSDDFDFSVEVEYISGNPCDTWDLVIEWNP